MSGGKEKKVKCKWNRYYNSSKHLLYNKKTRGKFQMFEGVKTPKKQK